MVKDRKNPFEIISLLDALPDKSSPIKNITPLPKDDAVSVERLLGQMGLEPTLTYGRFTSDAVTEAYFEGLEIFIQQYSIDLSMAGYTNGMSDVRLQLSTAEGLLGYVAGLLGYDQTKTAEASVYELSDATRESGLIINRYIIKNESGRDRLLNPPTLKPNTSSLQGPRILGYQLGKIVAAVRYSKSPSPEGEEPNKGYSLILELNPTKPTRILNPTKPIKIIE